MTIKQMSNTIIILFLIQLSITFGTYLNITTIYLPPQCESMRHSKEGDKISFHFTGLLILIHIYIIFHLLLL